MNNLDRFIEAQENIYDSALEEIKEGKKESHWMWFIFPQLSGLGRTMMANYYGITGIDEAREYLDNEILGSRLREISTALLTLEGNDPVKVLGSIDALKLCSSMTLFEVASNDEECVFGKVIDKYYGGKRDELTLEILSKKKNVKIIK